MRMTLKAFMDLVEKWDKNVFVGVRSGGEVLLDVTVEKVSGIIEGSDVLVFHGIVLPLGVVNELEGSKEAAGSGSEGRTASETQGEGEGERTESVESAKPKSISEIFSQ